jgi:hypothetical protein
MAPDYQACAADVLYLTKHFSTDLLMSRASSLETQ